MPSFTPLAPYTCRPCLRRLALQQTRTFTSTPSRRKHGAVPSFTPTTSSDLNTLLTTIRTNIFLPAHLISLQHSLLYRKKNHPLLLADEPATVRLGSEVHQLLPLDHKRDEPQTKKSVAKITQLMTEINDWRNLPSFLEGLKSAGRNVKGWQMEKMVRRAAEGGRQATVLDCLRRVEATGMSLSDLGVAREVLWGALLPPIQEDFSEDSLGRAIKYVDNIWELLCEPRHTSSITQESDPRRRPDVLGVMVLLHATRAVRFGDGKDGSGEVEKWTGMMLAQWENGGHELDSEPDDWIKANYTLLQYSPVYFGAILAERVLPSSSPLSKHLNGKISGLRPLLDQCRDLMADDSGKQRRGLKMYESLSKFSE